MDTHRLTIRQLDRQLAEWQNLHQKYGRPRAGWVKTLRVALSMSAEQLARRLGLTRSRITQLENAEVHDSVTLRTLREVANAMECEFIYAIVPKKHFTLESIVTSRIKQIAREKRERIAHSMSLEAQSLDAKIVKKQIEELTQHLMTHLNKKIWATPEPTYKNQNILKKTQQEKLKKLCEKLQKKK